MINIDDLRWIRIFNPSLVPKYLIEQIKKRDYTVNDFFKHQEAICLCNSKDGLSLNPFSHLYVLATNDHIIKGVLWFTVEPLAKDIVIQTYSVDKEYWCTGAVKKLADHIKEIRSKANLNKIYWITDYPKHSKKHGFKQSKSVLMEYDDKCEITTDIIEKDKIKHKEEIEQLKSAIGE